MQSGRTKRTSAGSIQPANLFLGHHALDILGLAFDAVARASVRLDRQAGDDGIDAALLGDGATLRPLQLVMDVIIDREIVSHRLSFSLKPGLYAQWTGKAINLATPRQPARPEVVTPVFL